MNFGNNTLLLSTKLKIPTPRKNYVIRRKLYLQLDTASEMSVIFIQGGAGTGKTTLVSSYIRERQLDTIAWLSLDSGISNLYSFWLYFASALCPFLEDGDHFLNFMKSADIRNVSQLIIMLINRIQTDQDYYLVLDDVHALADPELITSFELFLQSVPENLHLFMLSREEPPVYLGSLAVAGRLLFIDSSHMVLSEEEGMDFLIHTLNVQEPPEKLAQLNRYAEGWIGGLQLVVAAKSMGHYSGELLKAGGGIATAYLNRELFENLNDSEKDFLVKTGAFSYFDYGICASIFPDISQNVFRDMVESLIAKNLFIIILDEEKEIYRYHNILSEYLKQLYDHLPDQEGFKLRKQAAKQLEQRNDYEEALRLYDENKDYHDIMRIAKTCDNSFETVTYLDKIPIHILVESPELAALSFMYNIWKMTDIERTKNLFLQFKEKYEDSVLYHMLSFAEILITDNKRIQPQLNPLTVEQIEQLDLNKTGKAFILIENSAALMDNMKYEEAEKCIRLALTIIDENNVYVEFFAIDQLAQIYEEVGRLNDSLECYLDNKKILEHSSAMLGMESNYYFGLLGVYMRRMDLDESKNTLSLCEATMQEKSIQSEVAVVTLLFHHAEMNFLLNKNEQGKKEANALIKNYPNYSILSFSRLLYELECLDLLDDTLKEQSIKELNAKKSLSDQPFYKILYARLIYNTGMHTEAMEETEEVLTFARKNNNLLRLVEAGILKLYMLTKNMRNKSITREIHNLTLEVIHYACENRILLPIYLDRSVMLPLLTEIQSEYVKNPKLLPPEEYEFVQDAVLLCKEESLHSDHKGNLTQREIEILKELSLGITNKEIADKLCISPATVKTHVLSVYSKLGVSSRLMAAQLARKEGII